MKEKRQVFDMTAMQNTSSMVKPINTIGLEGPVIDVVIKPSRDLLAKFFFISPGSVTQVN